MDLCRTWGGPGCRLEPAQDRARLLWGMLCSRRPGSARYRGVCPLRSHLRDSLQVADLPGYPSRTPQPALQRTAGRRLPASLPSGRPEHSQKGISAARYPGYRYGRPRLLGPRGTTHRVAEFEEDAWCWVLQRHRPARPWSHRHRPAITPAGIHVARRMKGAYPGVSSVTSKSEKTRRRRCAFVSISTS